MNELFEKIFNNAGIGIAVINYKGDFLQVNNHFCKVCGHDKEFLLRSNFKQITHKDDIDTYFNFFNKLTSGEINQYSINKRYIANDGTEKHVILSVSKFEIDNNESAFQYIAQVQDRKEINELKEKLFNLKNTSELAFSSAKIGTWSMDIESKEMTWDDQMLIIYETEETWDMAKWVDAMSPSGRITANNHIQKAIDEGIYESEFRVHVGSGIKNIYARGKVIQQEGKKTLIGVNIDMTGEYQARIKLQESEHLLDKTQSLTQIGGWKYVVADKAITWSRAVYDIHQVPMDYNITEQGFYNFFPGNARNEISEAMKLASDNGIAFDLELPFITAKNRKLWVRCIGQPIMEDGKIVYIVGCIIDITEHVSLKNSLEKANAELSRFAYAASHDLKEPLRKVAIFGDLLNKSLADKMTEKEARFMSHIIKGSKKMQKQIDDLLMFSKISSFQVSLEDVNLNEIVAEALNDVAASIVESDACIKVEELTIIRAYRPLLKSLILNLLSNAIKYRDDNRHLNIKIWHEDREGIGFFFIKDNGIGFNEKYKEQIFEPFKRLHTGDRYGGNGIGLATCSRICEHHGWEIGTASKENEGSVFWFTTGSIYGK